ncbi:MAG: class I SAM-dependent methyltransferase [Acidobacteriaceae bacterium]|nr:class I SAM-dependent methyltransferase [Acidobacteriaceae bacterium]
MPNPLLALEAGVVGRLLDSTEPLGVIDVGCGTGRWMLHFRRRGTSVFGLDLCAEMLSKAEKHPELRGRLVLGDAQSLPFPDNAADLTLCSFGAAYMPDLPRVFAEMARVCARGGRVLVSDLHPSAAAAGWNRSFKVGASAYELEHFVYSAAQIREAAASAGLQFQTQSEAYFGEAERPIFERAGKQHLISDLSTVPAIWVGLWSKP